MGGVRMESACFFRSPALFRGASTMSWAPYGGILEGVDGAEIDKGFFSTLSKVMADPVSGSKIARALDVRFSST
jgi:hypothetical protein